ncbi:MAG: transcription elongation factor GreB [Gammaproteobacteria bacterium]|nr:transcription elongation factor GreB [Gammaproteobacteria bacterium]
MEKQKAYITSGGAKKLRQELDTLWRNTRREVTQQVSEAAALGDRSENADYIYGKKRLREIDKRIRYLSKRLENITIVEELPKDQSTIYFGAWVKIEKQDGEVESLRIVGSDEIEPDLRWISINSPMAKALIGKKKGSTVTVNTPEGEIEAIIHSVEYRKEL